jgi:hypothetical protein
MVWANQPFGLASGHVANHRSAMAANVVQRPRLAFLIARDNNGIRIDFDGEVVADVWNLTGVSGKKPPRPPHALAVQLIHFIVRIKLS